MKPWSVQVKGLGDLGFSSRGVFVFRTSDDTTPRPGSATGVHARHADQPREDRTRLSGVTGTHPAPLIRYAPPPIRSAGAAGASTDAPHKAPSWRGQSPRVRPVAHSPQ